MIEMNGRQRNAMNAQIWGKQNNSNYDGKHTSHDLRFRMLGCLIFVEQCVYMTQLCIAVYYLLLCSLHMSGLSCKIMFH